MKQARSERAAERRNTGDNGERVGVMYVGCNMVFVANVDNGGGGSLLLGRVVARWAVALLRSVPPPSPRPPRHLSLSLPPSLAPVPPLSRPFLRSQGKTLKSQQWSQREMGKKGRGMEHRGFG